jgi:hypothetical protein
VAGLFCTRVHDADPVPEAEAGNGPEEELDASAPALQQDEGGVRPALGQDEAGDPAARSEVQDARLGVDRQERTGGGGEGIGVRQVVLDGTGPGEPGGSGPLQLLAQRVEEVGVFGQSAGSITM